MKVDSQPRLKSGTPVATFRLRLLGAMTLIVLTITALGLYFAQEKVAAETEHDLARDFRAELETLHDVQEVREAALNERCRSLVGRARIHAALEDDALDLLYPSAHDELRDVMQAADATGPGASILRAHFYRFLDAAGTVIPPPNPEEVGRLRPEEEAQLALPRIPERQQFGFLSTKTPENTDAIDEIVATPIISNDTGSIMGALVLGFSRNPQHRQDGDIKTGLRVGERVCIPTISRAAEQEIAAELTALLKTPGTSEKGLAVTPDGHPHRLFFKCLNPGSLFPPSYEVTLYPLDGLLARQEQLRWQAASACALLLLGGVLASHFIANKLAAPVEKLAVVSEENRTQRARAEAALEVTSLELQRAARFSADASHQLKTPVAVLRAGLEELLAQERSLSPEICGELSALVHQTFRLTNIIDDLLLLSRMDAGRLRINFKPVNLTQLLDGLLDDLSALPNPLDVEIESRCPAVLVSGEECYVAIILLNLLENARKYNQPEGCIRIGCREEADFILLTVANTGAGILPAAREHIFERFHRGTRAENVPGHGLGLNLARELAVAHGGDLRLARADEEWTAFELRLRRAADSLRPRELQVA